MHVGDGSQTFLYLDHDVVFSAPVRFLYYYSKGILTLYFGNPSRIYVGSWSFDESAPIDLNLLKEYVIDGSPFSFGTYKDELIIATNTGTLYSYEDGTLNTIRASDGTSFQIYSMINVYDQLLMGHYPSGSLYIYDDRGLREFLPRIPVPDTAREGQREAQTLTLFGGQLYAGIWPWGELWRLNFDTLQWHFVSRVFQSPEMSPFVDSPYEVEMAELDDEYNYWGQRIMNLVPFHDGLYVSTMNKRGRPYIPDQHTFLTPDALEEYGMISRISGPTHLTGPFEWRRDTTFRFKVVSGVLYIYQDRILQAVKEIPTLMSKIDKIETIVTGEGVYGAFAGISIQRVQ